MENKYFDELELMIGLSGMRSLLADLTCEDLNNWHLAKKWDLSIYDIGFLRKQTLELCGHVLREEKQARPRARIFSLSA